MRTKPNRGSHLPVLMKVMSLTNGPVAELGCGMYSSTFLHWYCFPRKRKLVTFEDNPEWFQFINQFEHPDFHKINCVTDWDKTDLSGPWSVAFIDHDNPYGRKRYVEAARFTEAEYVVCHDAENAVDSKYGYSNIYNKFKYRWKYTEMKPYTMVFSNVHDVSNFSVV